MRGFGVHTAELGVWDSVYDFDLLGLKMEDNSDFSVMDDVLFLVGATTNPWLSNH